MSSGKSGVTSVAAFPTPETERYVTRQELANHMGVSVATIDRMVAGGMPSVTWGRRTRRFRMSVAVQWARTQQSGRMAS